MIARKFFVRFFLSFLVLAAIGDASAQVRVDLALRRSLFIRYEPVVAIVTITNMSGAELELADEGNHKWFSFLIEHPADDGEGDTIVAPYNPDYTLSPVTIGPGESIKRGVNITPLYPLAEYGIYRLRATVYDAKTNRYYSSNPPLNLTISEGTTLWSQTVGTPGVVSPDGSQSGEGTRAISLLSQRLPDNTQLYLRIEDKERGLVYCTTQLGRYVIFDKPKVEIAANNDIHILQNLAPKLFLYTHTNIDGKLLEQKQFASTDATRPELRRDTSGGFQVVGGMFIDPKAIAARQAAAPPPPSISDRPVPLPKP